MTHSLRARVARALLVAAAGWGIAGCGTQNVCEEAVDHLTGCGINAPVGVETCDAEAEQQANDILAADCDSLTERATSSFFGGTCFWGWSTEGRCCRSGYNNGKQSWSLPGARVWVPDYDCHYPDWYGNCDPGVRVALACRAGAWVETDEVYLPKPR